MLKLLVTDFWLVLLPVFLYLAWLALARKKAARSGEKKPGFFDGPWFWPVIASLVLLVGGFIWLGLANKPVKGDYIPAHMENHTLVPARIEPEHER